MTEKLATNMIVGNIKRNVGDDKIYVIIYYVIKTSCRAVLARNENRQSQKFYKY